jgi:hypothetical protein
LIAIDKELGHLDLVLRALVIEAVVAAHQKGPGGNTNHIRSVLWVGRCVNSPDQEQARHQCSDTREEKIFPKDHKISTVLGHGT